jgi:hypothetical protein
VSPLPNRPNSTVQLHYNDTNKDVTTDIAEVSTEDSGDNSCGCGMYSVSRMCRHNSSSGVKGARRHKNTVYLAFRMNKRITPNEEICLSASHSNFLPSKQLARSRDSAVGIATSYGLDDRGVGVRVPVWSRIFSSTRHPDRLWGPPNLLSNGYRGDLSPGVKRPEREIDHSPPASAEVKKMWIYTSTPPYAFMA